jgi:preprotein translocase subunit SecE
MKQALSFFSEVRLELTKVTWPKRDDVVKLTLIVFIISAIVAGYVGGLDFLFTKLLSFIVTR